MHDYDAEVAQLVPTWLASDPAADISATFMYRTDDPYAVIARFATCEGDNHWTFARELLLDGLTEAAGEGDVRVSPAQDQQIYIDLRAQDGTARLVCDRTALTWFVDQVFATIPEGEEPWYAPMDSWLAEVTS
jgi:hypothetical protein